MATKSKPGPVLRLTRPDGTVREIQTEIVPIGQLAADPRNVRVHGAENRAAIQASLGDFCQQKPIVVDPTATTVYAGSGTLAQMVALGYPEVWIVRSQLDPSALKAYAIADNRSGELAEWDSEALALQLGELWVEGFDLGDLGFDALDLEALEIGDLGLGDPLAPASGPETAAPAGPADWPSPSPATQDGPCSAAGDGAGCVHRPEPAPPDGFPSFDETIRTDYSCPKCGYAWSGNPKPV